jgi:hypothetical protein
MSSERGYGFGLWWVSLVCQSVIVVNDVSDGVAGGKSDGLVGLRLRTETGGRSNSRRAFVNNTLAELVAARLCLC